MPRLSKDQSVLRATLRAFIPYTQENLLLSFKPHSFFNYLDYLEKQTGAKRKTISATISRAKRNGLIKVNSDGTMVTTWRGKMKLSLKPAKKTRHFLVIIFDIPEKNRKTRDFFRQYLKTSHAEQVQKSVWKTQYDIYEELFEVIKDLNIVDCVSVFMADEISTSIKE